MAAHLSTNPTGDAAIFLNNVDAVQLIKHQQHSGSNSSSEDAFEDLVTNIYKSDSQAGKNRIRWLYLMLCVYDMFQRKFPGRTRVGCKMKGLIQTEFKTHIAQATSRNERDGAELADLLAKWFLSGQKLNLLCEEFGDGSPIILVDLLKQDFVEVRMTKTGKMKDASCDHLAYLRLAALAESSGANTLGGHIRSTLLREYPI